MRRLVDLAAPIAGINVLGVLALVIDTAMLGRLDNAEVLLTALGFAAQIVLVLMVAMLGLCVGTVSVVARAFGAGKQGHVNHVLLQATILTVLLSVVVGVSGNIAAPWMMYALGASEASTTSGLEYLRPLLSGVGLHYLMILYAAIMRGVGNTRIALLVSLFCTAVNVVANYVLIYGAWGLPALGMRGAAYGTLLSQAVGAGLFIYILHKGTVGGLQMRFRLEPIDRALASLLFRVGSPAALDILLVNLNFLAIVRMLGWFDEITVAAHGIGLRLQSMAFVPGLGIAHATAALSGQALGAGDISGAHSVARASKYLCIGVMTFLGLLIIFAVEPITALFDVDPQSKLGKYTMTWIGILGYTMPIVGWYISVVGVLQGAGDTATSLRINFYTSVTLLVPSGIFFAYVLDLGATGIWLSLPFAAAVRTVWVEIAFRRGRWAEVGSML